MNEIHERLASIDKHLAVYNEQLKNHIRRTELLEEKMETVDTHVKMVNGVFKFILGVAAVSALLKFL